MNRYAMESKPVNDAEASQLLRDAFEQSSQKVIGDTGPIPSIKPHNLNRNIKNAGDSSFGDRWSYATRDALQGLAEFAHRERPERNWDTGAMYYLLTNRVYLGALRSKKAQTPEPYGKDGAHEAIVLLTDGEDLEGRAQAVARKAQERGIPVYLPFIRIICRSSQLFKILYLFDKVICFYTIFEF